MTGQFEELEDAIPNTRRPDGPTSANSAAGTRLHSRQAKAASKRNKTAEYLRLSAYQPSLAKLKFMEGDK